MAAGRAASLAPDEYHCVVRRDVLSPRRRGAGDLNYGARVETRGFELRSLACEADPMPTQYTSLRFWIETARATMKTRMLANTFVRVQGSNRLRPVHLLRVSLFKVLDPNFPGDSP